MKSYAVHKGVESPLKIWGMMQRYFYIYSAISATVIAVTVGIVMASVQGEFRLGRIFLVVGIAFVVLIALRLFFIVRSGKGGYKESNIERTLSNANVTNLRPKRQL